MDQRFDAAGWLKVVVCTLAWGVLAIPASGSDSPSSALAEEGQKEPGTAKPKAESKKSKAKKAKKSKAKGEAGETPAVAGGGEKKTLSIDEQYVRDNLVKYLNPTTIAFLDDGRVRLSFNFDEKNPEHETVFTPHVSKQPGDTFRWTNREDEYWGTTTYTGSTGSEITRGLRLSNFGAAHLNLWFLDDIEAEMTYVSSTSSTRRHAAALVFTNAKHASIGSDHGTLCSTFTKGIPQKAKGTFEALSSHSLVRIKLVVRNGIFEAWKDGRKRESLEYKAKDFGSGRLGIVWREARSFISRLDVTARIDAKKMAAEFRKGKK